MPHTLPDPNVFIENTNRLLPQVLQDYPWQHVAWSVDGTEILAHAPTLKELYATVDSLGLQDFVVAYLGLEDELEPGILDRAASISTAASSEVGEAK